MNICLLGNNLTNLVLANILIKKKISVEIISQTNQQRVKKSVRTIAISNSHNYNLLQSSLKIDDIVDPRMTTVSTILKHVHKGKIESVYTLDDGEYEIIEAKISENSELLNKKILDINFGDDIRIGLIVRDKKVIVPKKEIDFKINDTVILIVSRDKLKKVEQLFRISQYY